MKTKTYDTLRDLLKEHPHACYCRRTEKGWAVAKTAKKATHGIYRNDENGMICGMVLLNN